MKHTIISKSHGSNANEYSSVHWVRFDPGPNPCYNTSGVGPGLLTIIYCLHNVLLCHKWKKRALLFKQTYHSVVQQLLMNNVKTGVVCILRNHLNVRS